MKYLVLLIMLAAQADVAAQNSPARKIDSAAFYQREMGKLRRKLYDSLISSEEFQALSKKYQSVISKTDNYTAFTLFTEILAADFTRFNKSIANSGFSPLSGPVVRFGMAISNKKNRTVVDFSFFSLDLGKKTVKSDEKIRAFFSNALLLDIGYDLIQSPKINIYPYAGLSMRTANIYYTKPVTGNPSFTDISNLVQNNQNATASYVKLGYQAGVGFDFMLKQRKELRNAGTMVFIKAGTNGVIGKETYSTETVDYHPGIKYGKWAITTGLKFFGRK